jgi:phosphoribosylamine--glycine ligase
MRERQLGDAGATVVIEELLLGEEASFHVVCDGERYVVLPAAQDHKRVHDGDRGPNTGGMGAYAPAPIVTAEVERAVVNTVVEPTLAGMAMEGAPFRGVLFVGLMIERESIAGGLRVPPRARVLEFNVRFGDPETSVIVPLAIAQTPLFDLLDGAARGDLREVLAARPSGDTVRGESALCVVMAAKGYPGKPQVGDRIAGLGAALERGAFVFHAGTAASPDGSVVTAGGRVLAVGGRAATLEEAAAIAYRSVGRIHWDGEHHRGDIGHRAARSTPKVSG